MPRRDNSLIAALDVGTTKICVLVGEPREDGTDVVGIGKYASRGLRKGVVVDVESTIQSIRRAVEEFQAANLQPIILCAPVIRPHMKKLTERFLPRLVVLSHNEIPESVTIQSQGMVEWSDAD